MYTKQQYIEQLQLIPHPEGGYYRETFRSSVEVQRHNEGRSAGTVIYFLIESTNFSAFHRLKSDEVWFWQAGSSATLHLIHPDGTTQRLECGPDNLQVVLPAETWFAASVEEHDAYTLVSCTVFPGFEFGDFELAEQESLCARYPQHSTLIRSFTRK
jgi:predicted cupin superfamily sugar epimerase